MWPLQPEPAPKPEATPRVEPALRTESAPRPQRPPTSVEEPIHWPGESEPPVTAAPDSPPPAPPRERKPRPVDPLAGLAEELSRIPPPPEPGLESRPPPRRGPRPSLPASPTGHTADAPPALAPGDQNLSEMAQRLEAALRRSPRSADRSGGERLGEPAAPRPEPAAPGLEDFAPSPGSRLGAALRRPFRTDEFPPQPVRTENDWRARGTRHGRVCARAVVAPVRRHAAPPVPDRRCPPSAPDTERGGRTGR